MIATPEIVILPDTAAVQQAAAERIATLATSRVAATGRFSMALSGGNTPRGLYQLLAQEPLRSQIPWARLWVVWGDERYVPYDNLESCYLMARETLLDHVPIPAEHIYPIPTSYADPNEAAQVYSRQVETLLNAGDGQLNLVLLGMGPDGHIASLFPHHAALNAPAEALAVAVDGAPKPPPRRISLTATALNQAAVVMFLVTGADKATTLQTVLHGPAQPQHLPAQLIRPRQGKVIWFVDAAAANRLEM